MTREQVDAHNAKVAVDYAKNNVQKAWNKLHTASFNLSRDKMQLAGVDRLDACQLLRKVVIYVRESGEFMPTLTFDEIGSLGIRGACDLAVALADRLGMTISDEEAAEEVRIEKILARR